MFFNSFVLNVVSLSKQLKVVPFFMVSIACHILFIGLAGMTLVCALHLIRYSKVVIIINFEFLFYCLYLCTFTATKHRIQ
jgi:hypothetical protein